MNQGLKKVAIIVSHPIQHFCPQYVSFARLGKCSIKVFFGSAIGYKKYTDKSFGKEISWGNLGLEHFDHIFLNGENLLPANKELDAPNISRELEIFAPDVVITYGYFQRFIQRAQRWAIENNIPLAFISDSEKRRYRPLLTELAKRIIVKKRFRNINYFLTVGDANEEYYRYYGVTDDRFIRMPFPIDITHYENIYLDKISQAATVRRKYGISDESIVCGVVGKLEDFKRQADIIEAMYLLESKPNPLPVTLLLVGTGPAESSLQELAKKLQKNKLVFTGFVTPVDLASLYTAMDIYIHPSEKDAHSLAISEAIYMGCPVLLSSKCGSYGPSDDVQPGKNGFVFNPGDINALSQLIAYIGSDKSLRSAFGEFSRRYAVNAQQQAHQGGLNALINIIQLNHQNSPGDN